MRIGNPDYQRLFASERGARNLQVHFSSPFLFYPALFFEL
jgi:hypothetical protein